MQATICLTGGGIKSATAIAAAAARATQEQELVFLHVDFGQPAAKSERRAVEALATMYRTSRTASLELPHMRQFHEQWTAPQVKRNSGVRGTEISTGPMTEKAAGKADQSGRVAETVSKGVFPVLLGVAAQCAARIGATSIVCGASRWTDGAHLGLPTASAGRAERLRECVHLFNILLEALGSWRSGMSLHCPLMDLNYAEIIQLAGRFHVPLERAWTCQDGGTQPCGECGPCLARGEGFSAARIPDPAEEAVGT